MQIINNQYRLSGNVDPLALVEEYGSPLYVYDMSIIERQFNRMATAFDVPDLRINYACKANTNINILKHLQALGAGLDAVSVQEVQLGLMAGYGADKIMYTPNCVDLGEVAKAIELGVRINIDNISMLEQLGHEYPNVPVGIRINPHIMAGGNSKISTGHIDSKFGISIHQLPHILKVVEATGLRIEGLHMHTGSDILDANSFLLAADILMNTAVHFPHLEYVDFGSGFKVPYKPDDIETDIEEVGSRISERFNQFIKDYGKTVSLIFEPGKFLVSQAGYFFMKVNVVKPTPSTVFLGVDSGLNHMIRPMFYNSYHRIENISNPDGKPRIYSVVGYICETDTFGSNRKIREAREGDVLCLYNAGAYAFSMSSNYNSRFRPAEVMIHEGKPYLIRRRETMEDILRNQVEIKLEENRVGVLNG